MVEYTLAAALLFCILQAEARTLEMFTKGGCEDRWHNPSMDLDNARTPGSFRANVDVSSSRSEIFRTSSLPSGQSQGRLFADRP